MQLWVPQGDGEAGSGTGMGMPSPEGLRLREARLYSPVQAERWKG